MATETTTANPEEIQGTTILTTKEPEKPSPEQKLFPTVEQAKAAAIKELEQKQFAEKQAAEKAAADKAAVDKAATDAAAEAAKNKAGTEPKPTGQEAKPGEPVKSAPKEYTLGLPEKSPLTKEDLDGLLKEAKESGLSEDEAKELLQERDQVARTAQTRLVQKQEQDLKNMVGQWKEAVKKDPELGGDHLSETAIKASRAFRAVASPQMMLFCEKTGFADHPELVRMMVKIHDLIGEDKFVGRSLGERTVTPTTMEEKAKKLFGNPIKEAVA